MIEIEKAEEYRCCNVCYSQQKVFNITFWAKSTKTGTQVSICEKCLNELKIKIAEQEDFEWCHDCKEYDQEEHCCHRWTKVIRNTVEEMKNHGQWIPVTEALPEEGRYLVTRYDYVTKSSFIDILWFEKNTWWNRQITGNFSVLAWMPLPEPWRGKR